MINDEADEIIKEFFDLLTNRYQNTLESMKGSEIILDVFFCITGIIK